MSISKPFVNQTSLFQEDIRPALAKKAQEIAELALSKGAQEVEVFYNQGSELSTKVRLGIPELLQEAIHQSVSIRIFQEHRAAISSSSDLSPTGIQNLVENAIHFCKVSEPDLLNELPTTFAQAPFPELSLWDEHTLQVSAHEALEKSKEAEAAALTFSSKIHNSEGASYNRNLYGSALACISAKGNFFVGTTRGTYQSIQTEVLCEEAGGKKRNGSYYTGARFTSNLLSPKAVGIEAAKRTLAQQGATSIPSQSMPVVFSPEAAKGILRLLASVVSGSAIYRQSSYLCGKEGSSIASPLVSVFDDPLLQEGPGSRPFDGEGLPSQLNVVVEQGILKTYLLDTYSAKKLNRLSNACASRSGGSPYVSPSNFILKPGNVSEEQLLQDLTLGFYVTDMMGFGFNAVTGDFSRGASGFLIENGQKTRPVSEVTISANFQDLFHRIDAIANQLDTRGSIMAPAIRVSSMMVAGQ